jgi:hypothetical protein
MWTSTRPSAIETYKLMEVERNVNFVMWRDRVKALLKID